MYIYHICVNICVCVYIYMVFIDSIVVVVDVLIFKKMLCFDVSTNEIFQLLLNLQLQH